MTLLSSQPLRIAHTESSLGWGGQELRILTESLGMLQQGHQVTLLAPQEAQIYHAAQQRQLPVQAVRITRKSLPGLADLRQWLHEHPLDCLITHSSVDSWLVALACRLLAKPPVVIRLRHISAAVPRNPASRWLYTRGCQHIVTTGEALRQQLIGDNGFPGARITSIPTGIDLQRFQPGCATTARQQLGLTHKPFVLGIVATMRSWKGHAFLLEALAKLQRPDLHLVMVGDGPMFSDLQQQVAQLNLGAQVTMPGNQEDVVPWLQACDLFVLPSYANEGVPQALMQAMACGIPVLSTPVGSISEIIQPQQTGLLVPPKDANALSAAILTLVEDQPLRQRLSSNGLHYAQNHFALTIMLERMEQVIRQTMFAAHTPKV
ncbi:glycosyltransferase family 4 protein [Candidatus Magnetaquicoccus inordinatus]|uniref:glycosyltransferase family 4 protein n=1 Tax=Candidatus Magnetaquicoccus inordinatus TaxID=2496818 RepID=UPI00102CBC94|nr:glycosyltransferase family 4 protein [Candidatus Magnetaquicoccus inordinatus]